MKYLTINNGTIIYIFIGDNMLSDFDENLQSEAAKVREAVEVYGGGFMQALGKAMQMADAKNLAKIKKTWPEEWDKYLKMYELRND